MQVTNWESMTQTLEGTVVHLTAKAFITQRKDSYYFSTIFDYSDETLGLVSNCDLKVEDGQLLQEIMLQ